MKIGTLVLATRNAHKVEEIAAVLRGVGRFATLREFPGAPEVVEDAATFGGNAAKKALELARWLAGRPGLGEDVFVLADDSGLEVDALGGAPGVHSARFAALDSGAAGNSPDAENNAKLLRLLGPVAPPWLARFRCTIALAALPAGEPSLFDGACEGRIIAQARGAHGFGYDPLFIPAGFDATFAELGAETKNRISHRSQALAKLQAFLAHA